MSAMRYYWASALCLLACATVFPTITRAIPLSSGLSTGPSTNVSAGPLLLGDPISFDLDIVSSAGEGEIQGPLSDCNPQQQDCTDLANGTLTARARNPHCPDGTTFHRSACIDANHFTVWCRSNRLPTFFRTRNVYCAANEVCIERFYHGLPRARCEYIHHVVKWYTKPGDGYGSVQFYTGHQHAVSALGSMFYDHGGKPTKALFVEFVGEPGGVDQGIASGTSTAYSSVIDWSKWKTVQIQVSMENPDVAATVVSFAVNDV